MYNTLLRCECLIEKLIEHQVMVLICSLSNQTITEYNTQTSLENTEQTSTITDNNQVQNKNSNIKSSLR